MVWRTRRSPLSNWQTGIPLCDIDRVGILVIQVAVLCPLQPCLFILTSLKSRYQELEITKTIFTTAGGVNDTMASKELANNEGDTTFTYQIQRNAELANNLKGKLLLVTGDIDNNVHPANTIRMVDALIRANKRFDFLLLPGQRHAFGDMTEYFFWSMADYFSEHLLGSSKSHQVDMIEISREKPKK